MFPSSAYRGVPSPEIKWLGNLTERLTPDLTKRLTGYLKVALTFSGFWMVERPSKRG